MPTATAGKRILPLLLCWHGLRFKWALGSEVMGNLRHSWFNLANYVGLENFNDEAWGKLILYRILSHGILFSPELTLEGWPQERIASEQKDAINYWENVRCLGIRKNDSHINGNSKPSNDAFLAFSNELMKSETNDVEFGLIKEQTLFDLIQIIFERRDFNEILESYPDYSAVSMSWIRAYFERDLSKIKIFESFQTKYKVPAVHPDLNSRLIEVDVSGSDEQIKEHFSDWLSNQRAADLELNRRSTRIGKNDFNVWIASKIIPYFDLVTISKIDRVRLSNHKIGDLLFPDEIDVDVAERVRKVTKPKAKKIMSSATIALLEAQTKEK